MRTLSLVLVSALLLPLGACARNQGGGAADVPYVARDVGTLYTAARKRLDQARYKEAALLFDEVERQHPYSVWARRAQLMSAFSYYLNRDYAESIQASQRFLAVHPGNRDAPYAYYLIALSYYEQVGDVRRDQKITRQAQDALGELSRRYPNTRYAADARLKLDLVADHLAGKEMEVGRFYETRGQWLAASMRFRKVVDDYQTTAHAPEALMRLTESYLALGTPLEAQKSAAVLGRNYPQTEWYERAFKLMRDNPAKPVAPVPFGQDAVAPGAAGTLGNSAPAGGTDGAPGGGRAPTRAPNNPVAGSGEAASGTTAGDAVSSGAGAGTGADAQPSGGTPPR